GWKSIADTFSTDPALQHIKWILPHARSPGKVIANFGMVMLSWHVFNTLSFDWKSAEDEKGLLKSTRNISELITAEVDAGIPANCVVVRGSSQGAISRVTGLTGDKPWSVVALSGWVPLRSKFESVRPHLFAYRAVYQTLSLATNSMF
ncbi:hypothetical protein BDN72DRAFT_764059, partial [Pluteus cervinus]